ncbi:Nn.00g046980.m01.CDS01 [Neocucurbitaria sp. VM-36]
MAVSEEKIAPRSTHLSDPALAPFLQTRFDPADYLNAALPSLSLSSVSSRPLKSGNAASLADLSSQTQGLLSQLNAHTTRLSAILTQLTDDILRSGGRLAYEVEVLRGETIGLTETLTDGLNTDIKKFLPSGIALTAKLADEETQSPTAAPQVAQDEHAQAEGVSQEIDETTPEYISDLRTLTTVRSRLETVIKVFGEAMHWTIPPSEISLGASLISVSAPEPGSDNASREQKGKEFAASLRSEIADLITGDPEDGKEKAEIRILALRDLAQVWKGTAEEKARTKFVDGLVKLAEDKQREIEREKERSRERGQPRAARSGSVQKPQQPPQQQRSGGFLENLQRIRGFVEQEMQ